MAQFTHSLCEEVIRTEGRCGLTHNEITQMARSARPEALRSDIALSAIDSEPELPGDMPDAMWERIKGDRDAVQEAMKIAVRMTKTGIRERYLAAFAPSPLARSQEKP